MASPKGRLGCERSLGLDGNPGLVSSGLQEGWKDVAVDAGEITVFEVDPGAKVVWSSPEVAKGSTDRDVDTELLSSSVTVATGESVGVEESETVLWSVGFWVIPAAIVPETAGLRDASPGLHRAAELPVPVACESRDDPGGSDDAGTVARKVTSPVRVESAWRGTSMGVESSRGLNAEAGLAPSVPWEDWVVNLGEDDAEGAPWRVDLAAKDAAVHQPLAGELQESAVPDMGAEIPSPPLTVPSDITVGSDE